MIPINRILCPTDFSECSRHALDHAVAIARCYESAVTLLHVSAGAPAAAYVHGFPVYAATALTPTDREALLASMRRFVEQEAGPGGSIQCDLREGSAAAEILAAADDLPADLLVMGSHGRSGFERLVLGSVTENVLRRATCPVLSVPRRIVDAIPLPPVLFRNILCAIDFSNCSIHALAYAVSLAQRTAARLTVLHAVELLPEFTPDGKTQQAWPQHVADYLRAIEGDRRDLLVETIGAHCGALGAVQTRLEHGTPYRAILRVAAEEHSDVIVIGVQGRGPTEIFFFGSTAQHVVRRATCPVLTLRTG